MERPNAIAIFDIGRTNRRVVVFDEVCRVLDIRFLDSDESIENGRTSLNLTRLRLQIESTTFDLFADPRWVLKAVNFTAYGATMVWLGADGEPVHPVVDYMDPFPEECRDSFEREHGPISHVCMRTASPWLGNLNSGLQLYALKKRDPRSFARIRYAVHLPQYLSSLLTGKLFSETTCIGCHTMTWDFSEGRYADWVRKEGIDALFPRLHRAEEPVESQMGDSSLFVGIGLHDSSSALIPYLYTVPGPFLLLSTGTWSICLNPFEGGVLTEGELEADCLNYMRSDGRPVKASRMPLGMEHDRILANLCERFACPAVVFHGMEWSEKIYVAVRSVQGESSAVPLESDLFKWETPLEAYHGLMHRLMQRQVERVAKVLTPGMGPLYVDGGFSGNEVFMNMLARMLPGIPVYGVELGQSTAVGAAYAMHIGLGWRGTPKGLLRFVPFRG